MTDVIDVEAADLTPENVDPPEATAPNAVVIHRLEEDGQIKTVVQPVGDVRATEVQTLLELGILSWREQIGLTK